VTEHDDRAVPVEPDEPATSLSTRAAGAIGGANLSALTENLRRRPKLGWLFWGCIGWIVLTVLASLLAGVLPLHNPDLQTSSINAGPSGTHWFGTDQLGRDIFSRVVFGSRVSLAVGFGSMAIALVIGGVLGMVAAYLRGLTDTVINAVLYVLLAFPALVALIALVTFWGNQEWHIIVIIGVAASPLVFRIVRATTLSYATREFVTAARSLGATTTRILLRELLPNILPTIVSFSLIGVATVIILEGSLAFLGLSIAPPTPSWGNMLNESRTGLTPGQSNPWLVVFPALAMFLFLLALNLVGDRLRQHFDVTEVTR
jgi:peptide/nickel transport system permease protein